MTDSVAPAPAGGITSATVTHEELRQFAASIGLSSAAPGRCSTLLMFDLYCRAFFPVPGDPVKVVAEIRGLEGLGSQVGTKPADQFKHPPLQGLWKKHYLVGGLQSLAANIQNGFGRKHKELRRVIEQHWNPATANVSPEVTSRNIANSVMGLYVQRKCKESLTGEWIVYARHEGQNYYLCLALHGEGDANIFDRIKNGCIWEFPFLQSQLVSRNRSSPNWRTLISNH